MRMQKWLPVLPPFAVALLGSEVYASLDTYSPSWGAVLGGLYYIPIVVAAITLGVREAVGVAIAAGTAHMLVAGVRHGDHWLNPIAQMALFICIAPTAARLAGFRREAVGRTVQPAASGDTGSEAVQSGGARQASSVVAGLVRHFRTPLASIEGASWVLDDIELDQEATRELVAIVRKEAQNMKRVISDVTDFMQPRQARFALVRVAAVVDDVIQAAQPKGQGPSYVFSKDVPADLPPLRGDPEQLRQALLNLVKNSVQALPGGGRIAVRARSVGNQVVIAVEDNGRGIPAGAADRIFEPFFTTREHSLGLGLPAALRIVTEHGGKLQVDCWRSEGVCISVILPIYQPARPDIVQT